MTTAVREPLSGEQILEMMEKALAMDSVELKLMVPDEQRMTLANLGADPLKAQIRQVYFFDTPDLQLYESGVIVRARRSQNDDDDTVIKRRPVEADDIPKAVRDSPHFKLELDATRSGYVISGSMKGKRPPGTLLETLARERPLSKLFTKEQRSFMDSLGVEAGIWESLIPLGPMNVIKLKYDARGISAPVTIEQWHYPGESPAVEISVTARPAGETIRLLSEARQFLRDKGLSAGEDNQTSKTRGALAFLSRQAGLSNQLTRSADAPSSGKRAHARHSATATREPREAPGRSSTQ